MGKILLAVGWILANKLLFYFMHGGFIQATALRIIQTGG